MPRARERPRIGDKVIYPVTGTRGRIAEIRKINGRTWALIEPIYVWIEYTKLLKVSDTKQDGQAHRSQASH